MSPFSLLTLLTLLPTPYAGQLGDRDFRKREAAQRALAGFGPLADPALEVALQSPDPEVRQRAKQLRPGWVEKIAEEKSRRLGKLPWIDEGVVGEGAYRYYFDLAKRTYDNPDPQGDPYGYYREATRLWVRAMIVQRMSRAWILERVRWMQELEDEWVRSHR